MILSIPEVSPANLEGLMIFLISVCCWESLELKALSLLYAAGKLIHSDIRSHLELMTYLTFCFSLVTWSSNLREDFLLLW
jgi:hypothetical protein